MPIEPPEGEKIIILTPITLPLRSKVGPPESPLLIGASICRRLSELIPPIVRSRAETMPAVTVPPSPKGLPTASTQSPTRGMSSASLTKAKSLRPSTFSNARSLIGSLPTTFAL